MANALYDLARKGFLDGSFNWATATTGDVIQVALVQTGTGHYVVNTATDQYLSAIASGDIIRTSGPFTAKDDTAGVADAADVTFTTVSGSQCGALVIYKAVGTTMAVSPLLAYIDTATGLPITPNGGDITVVWDNGANRIFKL